MASTGQRTSHGIDLPDRDPHAIRVNARPQPRSRPVSLRSNHDREWRRLKPHPCRNPFNNQERNAMSVVLIHEGPSLTKESYEDIVRKLTGGKARLESPSDWPVEGLLVHAAGQSPKGFRVVDVWQSREACDRFGEILAPILQEVGVDDGPEIYDADTFVSA
jgi:hypothetical protein